jgi:hypothetical protein
MNCFSRIAANQLRSQALVLRYAAEGEHEALLSMYWAFRLNPTRLAQRSFPRGGGGAPEGKRNGNYRHGGRTKAIIDWRLIKSLR